MPPDRVNRNARVTLRLKPEDWVLLRERAQARRMPSATYVSLLVRPHLRDVAPVPKAEYVALKRSEEHTSELQSRGHLVCRLLLEKKKKNKNIRVSPYGKN